MSVKKYGIRRYDVKSDGKESWAEWNDDGEWVRYVDHAAEVEKMQERVLNWTRKTDAHNKRLREALADAIECVESWAAYATPYFQEKHNLSGDLARLRWALEEAEGT